MAAFAATLLMVDTVVCSASRRPLFHDVICRVFDEEPH